MTEYQLCNYGELYNDPCEGEVYRCSRNHTLCSIHLVLDEHADFERYLCPLCDEEEIETWVRTYKPICVISNG